ncbi:Uncharacterized protein FKW44_015268, partial [Caligus rogercresseyi]
DLRQKNYKAMDALKQAEHKLVSQEKSSASAAAASADSHLLVEQQKQFLARLLPSLRVPQESELE